MLYKVVLVLCFSSAFPRNSDYKRIIFSETVTDKLKTGFENDTKKFDRDVIDLFNTLMKDYEKTNLTRLQPEKNHDDKRILKLHGNRKKELTLTTLSKRRPLVFQIDDFLFEDECQHIINLAEADGLADSLTTGEAQTDRGKIFDDIGEMPFEDIDMNNDLSVNASELRNVIFHEFGTKMSEFLIKDLMKKTYMDFNLDGVIVPWEWSSKNLTQLVIMLNESMNVPSSKVRTSQTQFLVQTGSNDPILQSLQDRLQKVTGLPNNMIASSEPLQVVYYEPGGHYDCHMDTSREYYPDNFLPCCHTSNVTDLAKGECSPCRFMTVLFYLSDTELGGETAFPVAGVDPYKHDLMSENINGNEKWCDLAQHCSQSKLIVKPKKGRAIIWYNHFLDPETEWTGAVDPNSLHGGCAVHKGTKWIANNWINAGFHKKHDFLSWAHNQIHPRDKPDFDEFITEEVDQEDESNF